MIAAHLFILFPSFSSFFLIVNKSVETTEETAQFLVAVHKKVQNLDKQTQKFQVLLLMP